MTDHDDNHHILLEISPYHSDDGQLIGKDPRRLVPDQLRAADLEKLVGLKAMRAKCLECCGDQQAEVRKCVSVSCALWPFRMSTNPWNAKSSKPKQDISADVPIVD